MPEHTCCLAIDVMGGDQGPRLVVPAVLEALRLYPQLTCELHGHRDRIEPLLARAAPRMAGRLSLVHAEREVAMGERPANALRNGRESSMWQALSALAEGRVDGCVSAGNTGALMLMSLRLLGMVAGLERPAICTSLPTRTGRAYLLDMGANLQCQPSHLHQFAHMAVAMVEELERLPAPRVGLLNVGSEAGKGDAVVQEAARLLAADSTLNYMGFVEGDGIFSGGFDIVVSDGFAGNVALKTTEGVAALIGAMLREELTHTLRAKLGALIARPALGRLQNRLDPSNYNGASLLGLQKPVIKSHGGATRDGFTHAIGVALGEIENNIPARIFEKLERSRSANA